LRRHLKSLADEGFIEINSFNKRNYDQTKWYTVVDEDILKALVFTKEKLTTIKKEEIKLLEAIVMIDIPKKYAVICDGLDITQRCYSWFNNDQLDELHDAFKHIMFIIKNRDEADQEAELQPIFDSKISWLIDMYENRNNKNHEGYRK